MSSRFLLAFSSIIVCFRLVIGCSTKPDLTSDKPNIILILADDLGNNDTGFQGSTLIKTPNLDALASNGTIFSDAHVSATVCSPSRAGILTGRYQQFFGHEANIPPHHLGTDTTQVTIADMLRANGYTTSIIGKWHLGETYSYQPNSRGFDHFWGYLGGHRSYFAENYPEGHHMAVYTNRTYTPFTGNYFMVTQADTANAFIERSGDKPFFLYLSFSAPHAPLHALEEDKALFPKSERQVYAAMVWAMDRAVGKVVQKLKELNKLDNTLIVFLSDNGGSPVNNSNNLPFKGFKGNKFEGGHRVPFFVHWGNKMNSEKKFDGLSSSLDLFPTFLAAAGIEKPADLPLNGVNLLPYLEKTKTGNPHEQLFFRKELAAAVRDANWKLIRLDDFGYALYDLSKDPYETKNLISEDSEQAHKMKSALEQWEKSTVKPWWNESKPWQKVTFDIHVDLIKNQAIRRLSPK